MRVGLRVIMEARARVEVRVTACTGLHAAASTELSALSDPPLPLLSLINMVLCTIIIIIIYNAICKVEKVECAPFVSSGALPSWRKSTK